jgi:hypothetical protein
VAAGIEAEVELWTAYLALLAAHPITGAVLTGLHDVMIEALSSLGAGWDERFMATRRLIAKPEPALLACVEWYRATVKNQVVECLGAKLGLELTDLRLYVLAELGIAAFTVSGRHWVRNRGRGGRKALIERFDDAIGAIPSSLELTSRRWPSRTGFMADPPSSSTNSFDGSEPNRTPPSDRAAPAHRRPPIRRRSVTTNFLQQSGSSPSARRAPDRQLRPREPRGSDLHRSARWSPRTA